MTPQILVVSGGLPSSAELRDEMREELKALRARIEALTAERDAAVAALNMKPHERNSHALGIMEGERRGSAKAVAFMKREYAMDGWDVVRAIERGDHLTQP